MSDKELIARLNNLYAMLEEEGYYTKANTVSLVIDHIEKLEEEKRELVLQSLADSGQAQEAYAEVVRLKEGIQKAIAWAGRPCYGYLEDRIDNYYEALSSLKELVEK